MISNIKKNTRKMEKKIISLKNISEDLKTIYEDMVKDLKVDFSKNVSVFKLNENECFQIVVWNIKERNYFDLTHNKNGKTVFRAGCKVDINGDIHIEAIYRLDYNILMGESEFSDSIYKTK